MKPQIWIQKFWDPRLPSYKAQYHDHAVLTMAGKMAEEKGTSLKVSMHLIKPTTLISDSINILNINHMPLFLTTLPAIVKTKHQSMPRLVAIGSRMRDGRKSEEDGISKT